MLDGKLSAWPFYSQEEIDAVSHVLASNRVNYWTGNIARQFEDEFAAWCDTEFAIAVHNGTLALELALRALEIGPGDEVIVTPRSFIASASTVVNIGATPIFADIDPVTETLNAQTIEEVLTPASKAVIVVHLAGMPCDMDPIMELAGNHNLRVIEDCAQAHGASYKGRPVGSIGDIGAWSFCQDKIMTTGGEGGMVTTNDRSLWSAMWSYKDHGKSWEAVYEREHPEGYRWLHESIGSNFRMLEVQAAIGRIQLKKMAEWSARRHDIAKRFAHVCQGLPSVVLPPRRNGSRHAYYRFTVQTNPDGLLPDWDRDRIMAELAKHDIPVFVGACAEIYREGAFVELGLSPVQPLPNAIQVGSRSLAFLTHPTLSDDEVDKVASVMRDVFEHCSDPEAVSAQMVGAS
ncbi:MAG: DegT/DnrJ/EryC1/StrS aminotransferase family protein [Hyphomicrobiales bacterium]